MANHRLWKCPYYITNSERISAKLTVICKGGEIDIPDGQAVRDFCGRYCGSAKGWRACPMARMIMDAEKRKDEAHEKR